MSAPRLLVSLLPPDESEQVLRSVRRLLPAQRAADIALLSAPEPAMGIAALDIQSDDVIVVVRAPDIDVLAHATVHAVVWCRDDDEAEQCDAHADRIVIAQTIEQLAWELVRRLTGDLSDFAHGDADHRSQPTTDDYPAPEPLAPRPRRGSVLTPPSWARATGVATPATPNAAGSTGSRPQVQFEPQPSSEPSRRSDAAASSQRGADPPLTPLAALARMEVAEEAPAYQVARMADDAPSVAAATQRPRRGLDRVRSLVAAAGPRRREAFGDELSALGQGLMRAHSTVVVVGTPKGGPGKTTNAAALGVLGARAVEPHGGSAVLVDANLNNPDSWRQLAIPSDAVTVREVVDALNSRAVPPNGEFARDARLRVLPERRSAGSEYSAAEVDRLQAHLRLRHTLVVVDLPNSLPSLSEGAKEALVSHWLDHADVVVLPLDLGESSFIAAGEMLDALDEMASTREAAGPGLVVPLLLPPDGRRAAAVPQIASLLNHLRDAGARIVEVPYTLDVQTASHRGQSIVGASPRADRAFLEVLDGVLASRREPTVTHRG